MLPVPMSLDPLFFDDFVIGRSFVTGARQVSTADIEAFAALSADTNPVHLDPAQARRTIFRGCIAHGMLVESLLSGCVWQSGLFREAIVALMAVEVEFVSAVRAGDELRMELEVLEREADAGPRRGWVRFATRGLNQRGEAVTRGRWQVLVARRTG